MPDATQSFESCRNYRNYICDLHHHQHKSKIMSARPLFGAFAPCDTSVKHADGSGFDALTPVSPLTAPVVGKKRRGGRGGRSKKRQSGDVDSVDDHMQTSQNDECIASGSAELQVGAGGIGPVPPPPCAGDDEQELNMMRAMGLPTSLAPGAMTEYEPYYVIAMADTQKAESAGAGAGAGAGSCGGAVSQHFHAPTSSNEDPLDRRPEGPGLGAIQHLSPTPLVVGSLALSL